jgi:hypothetical protein
MKDKDKVSLVAIDIDRRILEEMEIGQVKGTWCQRDCIEI